MIYYDLCGYEKNLARRGGPDQVTNCRALVYKNYMLIALSDRLPTFIEGRGTGPMVEMLG